MDVYNGCETIKDTNKLLNLMDFDGVTDEENTVCGITVPTLQSVEDSLKFSRSDFEDAIGGTLYEIFN